MALYGRRERLREIEAAEAAGEVRWTDRLDDAARIRIAHAVDRLLEDVDRPDAEFHPLEVARSAVLEDLGLTTLTGEEEPGTDFRTALRSGDERLVFSCLESLLFSCGVAAGHFFPDVAPDQRMLLARRLPHFRAALGTILAEHRLAYDLVGDHVVPRDTRVLPRRVVGPTLTVLGGRADLRAVEEAFSAALDALDDGRAAPAVAHARDALEACLAVTGDEARSGTALPGLLEWIGAAAVDPAPSPADATLVVHVVAAVLLRLAAPAD